MKFRYSAMDSCGREVNGFVDAKHEVDANSQIKEKGYFPTAIKFVSDDPNAPVMERKRLNIDYKSVMVFMAGVALGIIITRMMR